jgi:hypothetical protein
LLKKSKDHLLVKLHSVTHLLHDTTVFGFGSADVQRLVPGYADAVAALAARTMVGAK